MFFIVLPCRLFWRLECMTLLLALGRKQRSYRPRSQDNSPTSTCCHKKLSPRRFYWKLKNNIKSNKTCFKIREIPGDFDSFPGDLELGLDFWRLPEIPGDLAGLHTEWSLYILSGLYAHWVESTHTGKTSEKILKSGQKIRPTPIKLVGKTSVAV